MQYSAIEQLLEGSGKVNFRMFTRLQSSHILHALNCVCVETPSNIAMTHPSYTSIIISTPRPTYIHIHTLPYSRAHSHIYHIMSYTHRHGIQKTKQSMCVVVVIIDELPRYANEISSVHSPNASIKSRPSNFGFIT